MYVIHICLYTSGPCMLYTYVCIRPGHVCYTHMFVYVRAMYVIHICLYTSGPCMLYIYVCIRPGHVCYTYMFVYVRAMYVIHICLYTSGPCMLYIYVCIRPGHICYTHMFVYVRAMYVIHICLCTSGPCMVYIYVCVRPGHVCYTYMFVYVRAGTVDPAPQQQWLNDALSSHTVNVRRHSSGMTRGQLGEDLGRLHVDICRQEMKSSSGFDARSGHYRLLGLLSLSRHYGLAFAVATHSEDRIVRYWSLCQRIAVTQLHLTSALLTTILFNVYKKINYCTKVSLRFLLTFIYNI